VPWRLETLIGMKRTNIFVLLLCAAGLALPVMAQSENGAQVFTSKCAGCHTLGKGQLVGPDLKDVCKWKEADIESNVKRMEKMVGTLPDADVQALVKFLKKPDAAAEQTKVVEVQAKKEEADNAPASSDEGASLFFGKTAFENGGTSCIACHSVQGRGGSLAKDLTDVYSRMGKAGIVSVCTQPSFAAMKPLYTEHPITKQEALHLAMFFEAAPQTQRAKPAPVEGFGSAAAIAVLLAIAFGYRNRKTGAREKLAARQVSHNNRR
jgi:cytochrome c2